MRIGLPGGGTTIDQIVRQAERAEAEGFTSLWYASAVFGDPLVAIAIAGHGDVDDRAGHGGAADVRVRSVLHGEPRRGRRVGHRRARRFTLGIGPSHPPVIEGMFGLSYATPGRHTDEYVQIVARSSGATGAVRR